MKCEGQMMNKFVLLMTILLMACNAVFVLAINSEPSDPIWPSSVWDSDNRQDFRSGLTQQEDDEELVNLLEMIEQTQLPEQYTPQRHQPYVDKKMAALGPEQRQRVGFLWQSKQRLQPKMANKGASFVQILKFVEGDEKLPDDSRSETRQELRPKMPNKEAEGLDDAINGEVYNSIEIDSQGEHWHHWRGPSANGTSPTAHPPVEWGEEESVRWKVEIEGQGNASPIVFDDKVFLLTAINTDRVDLDRPKPEDQPKRVFGITYPNTFIKFQVLCLDRNTGKELWRKTATELVPHEGTHRDADFASASPTTDGERLYCWFGSAGLYCYDLDGNLLWERDLGKAYVGASLGEACSPVVHNRKLVLVRDHAGQSSIEVLDTQTGETVWKKERNEPNAWATPAIVDFEDRTQIITAASNKVRSYDLASGEIIWQCGGLTGNVTPCPIVDGDVVYCMSGYEGYSLLALPLGLKGDVSAAEVAVWSKKQGTPYVPSPVLFNGTLYFTQSNQAVLTSLNAKSGETVLPRNRLPSLRGVYSSPVAADGRIYFTGRSGVTLVIEHSNELKILATNKLNDEFHASPALVGNQLFLRGRNRVYCIEEPSASEAPRSN